MKDSPTIRITMEGVEGYVEVTRAVMDALCFTTTDHLEYAKENYAPEDKGELSDAMKRIIGYMWQVEANI